MTRLLTFTIISLLLAAGATALPQPATTVRVNDMVVLDDGTAGLQVDPVGGFNDTTRDPAWQSAYVESLKRSHLLDKTVYERRSVSHQPDDDDDDDDGGDENYGGFPLLPLLSKRQNRPEACLACMVVQIVSGASATRTEAYVACAYACADTAFQTIHSNVKKYWLLAGIGAYDLSNWSYEVWKNTGW